MTYSQRARTPARRVRVRWIRVAGLLVVITALATHLGGELPASSSSITIPPPPAASPTHVLRIEHPAPHRARSKPHGGLGEAGGAIPAGTTVFDDGVPGVGKLDPSLRDALRRAANDAGIRFVVDSGWRSPAYQEHLLQEAVAKYGSQAEAARWVATPNTSAHVSGDAVDLASAAAAWLSEHGSRYGLCRIYGNEPWHFELRPEASAQGCPPMYADPTHDPRMQQ